MLAFKALDNFHLVAVSVKYSETYRETKHV